MLGFFENIQAVHDEADGLYQNIELEYQHVLVGGLPHFVPHLMKVPSKEKGASSKPWHDNAYALACTAYSLLGEPAKGYQDLVIRAFEAIQKYQSDEPSGADDLGHPKIPALLNALRVELVSKCQVLVSQMAQFKKDPKDFLSTASIEMLLASFAERLVDNNKFGCTLEIFDQAVKKLAKLQNNRDLQKERVDLQYWFELNDKFNELVRPCLFTLVDRINNVDVVNLGSADLRASRLAKELLCELPSEYILLLKAAIGKKHQEIRTAVATTVETVVSNTLKTPLTFAYKPTTPVSLPTIKYPGELDKCQKKDPDMELRDRRRLTKSQA